MVGLGRTPDGRVRRPLLLAAVLAGALAAAAVRAGAQEPTPAIDDFGATPRSAMRGYLAACHEGDFERAGRYLDVRSLAPAKRSRAPELAKELCVVLNRTLDVDVDALSDDPEGATDDDLPPGRDVVGAIWPPSGKVDVVLERVGGDGLPAWQIAGATVRKIAPLYKEFGYGRLTELLPAPFFDIRFLGIELWQWLGILALALLTTAIAWLVTAIALRSARLLLLRSRLAFEEQHLPVAVGAMRLLLAALLFQASVFVLALPRGAHRLVTGVSKALIIFAAVWLALRITDMFAQAAERRFAASSKHAAAGMVPLLRRSTKVVMVALAIVATLQNFGFNVTGVLAALGVGGLAVALAAQKTLENLFGGVTLIADQPVRVGDLCKFGDRVGTVEDIGLRSTRVRTVERTVVSVANAEFASMQLENFALRDRIWMQATLGLRYETTTEQLHAVLDQVRKLLLSQPKVRAESARARFVAFGPTSLDVEVAGYVATTDWNEFLAIREDLFLRIIDIVIASGTDFAAARPNVVRTEDGARRERPASVPATQATGSGAVASKGS
jgi:MscS family membrane protein